MQCTVRVASVIAVIGQELGIWYLLLSIGKVFCPMQVLHIYILICISILENGCFLSMFLKERYFSLRKAHNVEVCFKGIHIKLPLILLDLIFYMEQSTMPIFVFSTLSVLCCFNLLLFHQLSGLVSINSKQVHDPCLTLSRQVGGMGGGICPHQL